MLTEKSRLVIAVTGTPIEVRVVPHKTDKTKLTLKSVHPEGVAMLLALADPPKPLPIESPVKGRYFFVTTFDRGEFLALMPAILTKILCMTVPTSEAPAEVPEDVDLDTADEDMDE